MFEGNEGLNGAPWACRGNEPVVLKDLPLGLFYKKAGKCLVVT